MQALGRCVQSCGPGVYDQELHKMHPENGLAVLLDERP